MVRWPSPHEEHGNSESNLNQQCAMKKRLVR
jgi:hypothetical protein